MTYPSHPRTGICLRTPSPINVFYSLSRRIFGKNNSHDERTVEIFQCSRSCEYRKAGGCNQVRGLGKK